MPPLVGVPPKKYVEDIPMVQGEVHAKFSPDPSSSLGGEWRQTNKQTDRQTDTPFCFIYIDFIAHLATLKVACILVGIVPKVALGRYFRLCATWRPGEKLFSDQGLDQGKGILHTCVKKTQKIRETHYQSLRYLPI